MIRTWPYRKIPDFNEDWNKTNIFSDLELNPKINEFDKSAK